MRINYSIIFVSDMTQAIAFYRDVVGLAVRFESPGWTEFATEGATLALHKSDGPAIERDGRQAEAAGQCRAGLQVPDLDAFHQRMLEHEVPCVQQPTETFGAMIANYVFPDGLIFSASQPRK